MMIMPPALMLLLTLRPRAIVWLWLPVSPPACTPLLTLRPRAIVWLWFGSNPPARTFVLIFIFSLSFSKLSLSDFLPTPRLRGWQSSLFTFACENESGNRSRGWRNIFRVGDQVDHSFPPYLVRGDDRWYRSRWHGDHRQISNNVLEQEK